MFSRLKTWTTGAVVALLALGSVGCGAYEPEPEVPQYQYAEPAPRPMTAEELAAWQAAHPEENEVAIGEDDNDDEYPDTDPSALTEFKPALEGHGEWIDDDTYGTVWKPSAAEVGTDFEPYVSSGHWTYSDDTDYVWVSDYSWGWAPFHYGRWVSVPNHNWVWIPGRQYAGAWVTWRSSPGYGYIGWAPAPPDYYWYRGAAVGWSFGFYRHYDHYAYCPYDRFYYGGGLRPYVVSGPAARVHYDRTIDYTPAPQQRVAAAPTVGGPNRVAARPTVGGRRGPTPDTIGMGRDTIVAPPSNDRARTLARPSTAVATGARPPTLRTASNGASRAPGVASAQPSFRPANPGVSRPAFAGNNGGASRVDTIAPGRVAAQPSFRSSAPQVSQPSVRPSPSFRPSSPSVGSQAVRPSSSPSRAAPSFRPSSPSVSAPRASAPSFRPSSPSVSAPRASAPPSMRSSGPSVSAPSRSSGGFRPSSPSVSRPSSGGGGGGSRASGVVRRR